jgi:hypothetical protein
MTYLGKVKVINTFYKVYTHSDYKDMNERSLAWDKQYDRNIDESKVSGLSGYCLVPLKEIHIYTGFGEEYNMNTLCHELWHALLYEIGYTHWSDEELIEKLSTWHPLMEDILNQGKGLMENVRVKEEPRSTQNSEACVSNS